MPILWRRLSWENVPNTTGFLHIKMKMKRLSIFFTLLAIPYLWSVVHNETICVWEFSEKLTNGFIFGRFLAPRTRRVRSSTLAWDCAWKIFMDFSHLRDPLVSISDEQNAFYFKKIGSEMPEFWTAMGLHSVLDRAFFDVKRNRVRRLLSILANHEVMVHYFGIKITSQWSQTSILYCMLVTQWLIHSTIPNSAHL